MKWVVSWVEPSAPDMPRTLVFADLGEAIAYADELGRLDAVQDIQVVGHQGIGPKEEAA